MQNLFNVLTNDINVTMQYELAIVLCAFFVSAHLIKDEKKLRCAWGIISLIFIYLHRALLPFLISGIYLFAVSGLVCVVVRRSIKAFWIPMKMLRAKLEIYTSRTSLIYTAVILTVLLIQLGRINIAIDYDSIRYGLRSDVLLTNGQGIKGFFANTGLVNAVYTYPKGFELLTRPLYFGGTFAGVLCVNVWILIAVILLSGEMAYFVTGADTAEVFAALMVSLIPGVTNMAVTAKSDLATVFCQLVFIYCVMRYLGMRTQNKKTNRETGIGIGALLLSYAFKPTSVVFSSFIGLAAILYFAVKKKKILFEQNGILTLILAVVFTGVITLRTFLITGQPIAGVFTEAFEKLGFPLHYPFRAQGFLYGDGQLTIAAKMSAYCRRLAAFLFCPLGEDMAHVWMAWGGIAFIIMLLVILVFSRHTREKMGELTRLAKVENRGYIFDAEAFAVLWYFWVAAAVISLISLYMLYQVDGNYFMLIYALSAVAGAVVWFTTAQYEMSPLGKNIRPVLSGGNNAAVLLLCVVMIYFTAFTSWCGATGFTKIDFLNKGYYQHDAEYLYDFGVWDKNARVLAFAYEPDCYRVKGRVESWVDIDGSGGNVYLTDTKFNIFKDYLEFADIDYIYADLNFLRDPYNTRRMRAAELYTWLLEDGSFEEVYLLPDSSRLIAKLDKKRVSVDWETELEPETAARIEAQKVWWNEIK